MQISEKTTFNDLPQIKNFSFFISGISVFDLEPVSFKFYDTGSNYFSFDFSGGFLKTDKTIYLYNSGESINIEGYVNSGKLFYKINDINSEKTITFSSLNKMVIDTINTPLLCDIFINSNPINYYFQIEPNYSLGGILTGKVITDVPFSTKDYSLLFYNSNIDLLSGENNLTGKLATGNNIFTLKDIDPSSFEYANPFLINFNTIFGNLQTNLLSYRGDFYNKNTFSLNSNLYNIYEKSLLFDGNWSGKSFVYSKNNQNYNLNYIIQNLDYVGNVLSTSISAKFEPFYPLNNSSYISEYVTGFVLTNSGLYSGEKPTAKFSKYYYVSGISQQFSDLLFSSGCGNSIYINYSGNSTGQASGYLTARNVYISGIYGNGIKLYKGIFNYTSYSNGSGYTGAPVILWGTGGNCFSLPDVSGEYGQFKKIHGTSGKIVSHSDYLTGIVLVEDLTTGYRVTGLTITNIGSGYNSTFPPKVEFARWQGDSLNDNASGILNYKQTGLYNFTGSWSINYNFSDSGIYYLNTYSNYYSGDIVVPYGTNSVFFDINLSGLDNTNPISGLFTVKMGYGSNSKVIENYIYNNRYFNTNTGALL